MACEPDDEGDQRRLVNIAPGKMLRAGEVVHFVAKDAVARGRKQMEGEIGERYIKDKSRTGEKAGLRRFGGPGFWGCGVHSGIFTLPDILSSRFAQLSGIMAENNGPSSSEEAQTQTHSH